MFHSNYMKRVFTFVLFLILLYACMGCGPIKHAIDPIGYHTDQVRKHQVRAMEHGAKLDTPKVRHKTKLPGINVEWKLNAKLERDTVINLQKDNVNTLIVYKEVKIKEVKSDCPPQEKEEDIPCPDSVDIKKPPDQSGIEWWEVLILVIVFISGMGVMKLILR